MIMEQNKPRGGACAAEFMLNCQSNCPIKIFTDRFEASSGDELRTKLAPVLEEVSLTFRNCARYSDPQR